MTAFFGKKEMAQANESDPKINCSFHMKDLFIPHADDAFCQIFVSVEYILHVPYTLAMTEVKM